jgi:hypothetical protein
MWVLLQVLPEGFKELASEPQEAEVSPADGEVKKEKKQRLPRTPAVPHGTC